MKTTISSGTPWENEVGYSRAIRVGNVIEISGTAPVRNGEVKGKTAYEQAKVCLEIIAETLDKLDGGMENVTRTRMFVTDISLWKEFGKAHAEFFKEIKPATSMVEVSQLIDKKMLIEIEVTALLPE
ncbi:MAG: RidA family protein [Bacteroidota bacterium]